MTTFATINYITKGAPVPREKQGTRGLQSWKRGFLNGSFDASDTCEEPATALARIDIPARTGSARKSGDFRLPDLIYPSFLGQHRQAWATTVPPFHCPEPSAGSRFKQSLRPVGAMF